MSLMKTLTIDGQTYDLSMKNLLDGTATGSLHTPTTVVSSRGQTVLGEYNIPDLSGGNNSRGNYSLIVGNGYQAARSNALTLDWNGNLNTIGDLTAGGNLMTLGMAGVIQMFGGETPPPGWLICDGSTVSRTTYPELFDAIGINWGEGDGSTTFNLPDLRGRSAIGRMNYPTTSHNLLKTDECYHSSPQYLAYKLTAKANLTASTTYTLQLWDIGITQTGKTDTTLGVDPFWGDSSNRLCYWRSSPSNDGITSLKSYTNYRGQLSAYAKHLTATFTTPSTASSNAGQIWLYNSSNDVTGTRRMYVGRWMLNTGSTALPWQPFEHVDPEQFKYIGNTGGISNARLGTEHMPAHTHTVTDNWYEYAATAISKKPGTSTATTTGYSIKGTAKSSTDNTSSAGSGWEFPTQSPFAVVNYIIATGKINI